MAADRDRPLSPHLQIYRLPLNAILSITHRLTGLLLVLGSVLFVVLLICAAAGSQSYNAFYDIITHWLGRIVLFGFTLALYVHLCTGIRHLLWDAGYGFELHVATRNSYIILAVAAGLTVFTWAIAYAVSGG